MACDRSCPGGHTNEVKGPTAPSTDMAIRRAVAGEHIATLVVTSVETGSPGIIAVLRSALAPSAWRSTTFWLRSGPERVHNIGPPECTS